MLAKVLAILLAVYSVHALAKFGFFFVFSYRSPRVCWQGERYKDRGCRSPRVLQLSSWVCSASEELTM